MFYSGRHTSSNGINEDWSPADINKLADNINNLGAEHRPRSGVVFEVPNTKTGHGNTLIALEDTPSAGDVVRARTRNMMLGGKNVRAIYGDIENVPAKIFNIYEGGGFPTVSPEIRRDYMGNGPTIRALALQGMMPQSLKGLPTLDVYSSLYKEDENKGSKYTIKFSEDQEETMNPEEIKQLVKDTVKASMGGMASEITNSITAQFAEFTKKDLPPEISPEAQKKIDDLQADIKQRDTNELNAKVAKFGEFVEGMKEREVNGRKLGLTPAVIDRIKTLGIALANPESTVVKFAEGNEISLMDGLMAIVKLVAEAKPLNFTEIDAPGDGETQAEAEIKLGKEIHGK